MPTTLGTVTSLVDTGGGNSYSFPSVDFDTFNADRSIILVICGTSSLSNSPDPGITSISIGDDSAPIIDVEAISSGVSRRYVAIVRGFPTGTSGTIAITTTGNFDILSVAVHRVFEAITLTDTDSTPATGADFSSRNAVVNITSGGFALAGANCGFNNTDITWTNATERAQEGTTFFGQNMRHASASNQVDSGSTTITATANNNATAFGIAAASYEFSSPPATADFGKVTAYAALKATKARFGKLNAYAVLEAPPPEASFGKVTGYAALKATRARFGKVTGYAVLEPGGFDPAEVYKYSKSVVNN